MYAYMKLNILSKLLILLSDAVVSFFLFQIVAGLSAYCYYMPPANGFLATWVLYYIVSYIVFRRTLGQYFFHAGIIDYGSKKTFVFRLIFRELTSSLPAVLLLLFGWNYLSPLRFLVTIGICSIFVIFRRKLFRIRVERVARLQPANEKRIFRNTACVFLGLIISATAVRIINTLITNSDLLMKERPMYAVPRPSGHSVGKYVDFLQDKNSDIKDYIFSLFEKYDHVILCERDHREMTQYDMIYDIVSDNRFVDSIGNVFTEIGCVDSREDYKLFLNREFKNEEEVDSALASFMTVNQSVHLLWPNTNWFDFLKRIYYLNHGKSRKVNVLFSDRNWIDRTEIGSRDSIMGDNIISTLRAGSLKKSLIIMNYRHAYLTPGNCGYYVSRAFPGKVANVLINTGTASFSALLKGEEALTPALHGKWDAAFRESGDSGYAFDFDGSPFGEDDFDHFVVPLSPVRALKYKDMFTGFIYYKAPEEQIASIGYNHIFDPENEKRLRARESELKSYYLDYWKEELKDGFSRQEGVDIYYSSGNSQNQIYVAMCALAVVLAGIMGLISYIRIYRTRI